MPVVDIIPLHETARERYLNYALSVITSRALPDIRDGLKPVQRRILYAMFANLHLYPDGRFRKSATVVGEVMGKYHPHGDSAIYEAMVRMAQDFSLRAPLVDGHGNFGSIDGDSAAAMRYTEAKLRPLAMQMLEEIRKQTVDWRPSFDGTLSEPIVLPARFPNLLVNGASGIAVGMATNIPPHNMGEVLDALTYMIEVSNKDGLLADVVDETADVQVSDIVPRFIKGPDFPTGGRVLSTEAEIVATYEKGEGAIELRGEYRLEGKNQIILYSIPYGITKSDLIEEIADLIGKERVPQLVDIRDESTDEIRVVLELKRGADAEAAMAYLFKHTRLQGRFNVNMTCLLPTDNAEVCAPQKVSIVTTLRYFLDFRMEVVTRRLRYDLEQLEKRIHILRGFEIIFDALDEAIRIIRSSRDKADAAQRLMHRFALDEEQTEAILETRLYKLAQLEIDAIRQELEEKERLAVELRALLASDSARWAMVRKELEDLRAGFVDARRTVIEGPDEQVSYSEEHYIIDEDVYVIVTRDGWVKRQRSYTDIQNIRVREGDEVGWVLPGSTRATVGFFSNFGRAYTLRIDQLPSTSGHGDPIQKHFEFSDRERVVGVVSFDARVLPTPVEPPEDEPDLFGDGREPDPIGPFMVAVTEQGMCTRLSIQGFIDASQRTGRTYMKPVEGDVVLGAELSGGDENVCMASRNGNVLIFPVSQISIVKGAAKGVIAMRLARGDRLLGYTLASGRREGLEIETSRGRREIVRTTKFDVATRGNKGRQIISRGQIQRVVVPPVEIRFNGQNGNKE